MAGNLIVLKEFHNTVNEYEYEKAKVKTTCIKILWYVLSYQNVTLG